MARWLLLLLAAALAAADPALLADLDLAAPGGAPPPGATALTVAGATWTADGLLLPAAAIARVPRSYPVRGDAFPAPVPPYRADLALPGLRGRAVTVTMVVWLAAPAGDQDNLFSLGPRSRWLSAQVAADGRLLAGRDNRWRLIPAPPALPALAARRWQVLSVGLGADGALLLAVGDQAVAAVAEPENAIAPPRPISDDPPVLSLADPGSARHLHGLLRRLIVHQDRLSPAAVIALHRRLAPAALPSPPEGRIPPPAPLPSPGGAVEAPVPPTGANDF